MSFIAKGTRRLTDGSFKGINHSEKIHLDLTEAKTVMYIIILHTDASVPSEMMVSDRNHRTENHEQVHGNKHTK